MAKTRATNEGIEQGNAPIDSKADAFDASAVVAAAHQATEAPKAEQATPRVVKPIPLRGYNLAEYQFTTHYCIAAKGTEPEDLHLHPTAFEAFQHDVTLYDDVRVVDAEDRWIADYTCVDKGGSYAIFALREGGVIWRPIRRSDADSLPDGYVVKQLSAGEVDIVGHNAGGYMVLRTHDNLCLSAGVVLRSFEEARRYLTDHRAHRTQDPVVRRT